MCCESSRTYLCSLSSVQPVHQVRNRKQQNRTQGKPIASWETRSRRSNKNDKENLYLKARINLDLLKKPRTKAFWSGGQITQQKQHQGVFTTRRTFHFFRLLQHLLCRLALQVTPVCHKKLRTSELVFNRKSDSSNGSFLLGNQENIAIDHIG